LPSLTTIIVGVHPGMNRFGSLCDPEAIAKASRTRAMSLT